MVLTISLWELNNNYMNTQTILTIESIKKNISDRVIGEQSQVDALAVVLEVAQTGWQTDENRIIAEAHTRADSLVEEAKAPIQSELDATKTLLATAESTLVSVHSDFSDKLSQVQADKDTLTQSVATITSEVEVLNSNIATLTQSNTDKDATISSLTQQVLDLTPVVTP
jgi:predicted  nucleic acid-binding Zn-ribbon protein